MNRISNSLLIKFFTIFFGVLFIAGFFGPILAFAIFGMEEGSMHDIRPAVEGLPVLFAIRTGVFSVLIGLIFFRVSSKLLVRPIEELSKAAEKVADGDLSVQIEVNNRKDELGVLIDNFNKMVVQLGKNEYLHKDFISNVSHEFKTPITAILGYVELLDNENLTIEEKQKYTNIIRKQSSMLSQLCTNLLRLSELDEENSLRISTFSIDEQIREILVSMQPRWEEKELQLELELSEILYMGDKSLLYQVWANLIGNAIKFTPSGGKIGIKVSNIANVLGVTVSDTGVGMTREEVEQCTNRFYKVDKSRTSSGTGLGLSIAKKIIDLHSGELFISSEENMGTEIQINLATGINTKEED